MCIHASSPSQRRLSARWQWRSACPTRSSPTRSSRGSAGCGQWRCWRWRWGCRWCSTRECRCPRRTRCPPVQTQTHVVSWTIQTTPAVSLFHVWRRTNLPSAHWCTEPRRALGAPWAAWRRRACWGPRWCKFDPVSRWRQCGTPKTPSDTSRRPCGQAAPKISHDTGDAMASRNLNTLTCRISSFH